MNSHQRFQATCNHRSPDWTPIDYLAHPDLDRRLREALGVETEEGLLDSLGCDFFYLPGRDISQNEGFSPFYRGRRLDVTDRERTCPLGIRWRRKVGASKFAVDEAIAGPLEDAMSPADVLNHPWPKAEDFDFSHLVGEAERHSDRVRIGGLWTGILGDSYRLHGFENFLLNIRMNPELIHALVDRMTEVYLDLNDAVFSALKGKMEVWFFGNDFGSQQG
ncbi:hypothetical protein HQ520_08305, partial [bacterium]|nr:hypothetical protein [bacterium]